MLVGVAVVVLNEAFQSINDLYLDEEEIFDGDLLSVVGGSFDTKRCFSDGEGESQSGSAFVVSKPCLGARI